jgi:hypothetical protein
LGSGGAGGGGSGSASGCNSCSGGGGGSGSICCSCTIWISLGASSGGWMARTSANTAKPPINTVAAPLVALGKSGGVEW